MRVVRIWFSKTGMSRYISHLDLMRTMTRAIRRSKIPLWYTEGFNPHPYLAFALPLSLGMESEHESMDIKIEGDVSNEEIYSSLSGVMPSRIEISAVSDPVMDPKMIRFGEFEISFVPEDKEAFEKELAAVLGSESLIVRKLGKKGHRKVLKDVDLIPHIRSFEIKAEKDAVVLDIVLPAGSAVNVSPELLAKYMSEKEPCPYSIKRIDLFDENMNSFK